MQRCQDRSTQLAAQRCLSNRRQRSGHRAGFAPTRGRCWDQRPMQRQGERLPLQDFVPAQTLRIRCCHASCGSLLEVQVRRARTWGATDPRGALPRPAACRCQARSRCTGPSRWSAATATGAHAGLPSAAGCVLAWLDCSHVVSGRLLIVDILRQLRQRVTAPAARPTGPDEPAVSAPQLAPPSCPAPSLDDAAAAGRVMQGHA